MDVKVEHCKYRICNGCLSTDRVVSSNVDSRLFYCLLGEQLTEMNEELLLCWECSATLKRIQLYQQQIRSAQVALLEYFCGMEEQRTVSSFSSLTTVMKEYYDSCYVYEEFDKGSIKHIQDIDDVMKAELYEQEPDMLDEMITKEEPQIDTKPELPSPCTTDVDVTVTAVSETSNVPAKRQNDSDRTQSIKGYLKYASVVRTRPLSKGGDLSKLFEMIVMTESEIEEVLAQHRRAYKYCKLQFRCDVCPKGYKRRRDLNRHYDLNHKTGPPFVCSECASVSESHDDLKSHWLQHSAMARCLDCCEVFRSTRELRKHYNRDHTKVFTCNVCGHHTNNLRNFSRHYKQQHESFVCDYCQRTFKAKHCLEKHMVKQHLPSVCSQCKQMFSSYRTLRVHRAIHGSESPEAAYCVECNKQFPSVYKYRCHIKSSIKHTPQPKVRIPCPDCGKIFTRKIYMTNHYKLVHTKTTRHYCELCDKLLITAFALRNHIKRVHEKKAMPKNKICDHCGRGFSTNRILINHIRTHTGERPFKCTFCPASFAQKTAMKSHEKSQHQSINKMVP